MPSNANHHEAGTTHSRLNQVINSQSISRSSHNPSSSNKRSRPSNGNINSTNNLTLSSVLENTYDHSAHANGVNNNSNTVNGNGSRRQLFGGGPSSSVVHPSLMYSSGSTLGAGSSLHYDRAVSHSQSIASATEWPAPTQLEGPGMPVARNPLVFSQPTAQQQQALAAVETSTVTADAEIEGEDDVDNKRYCVCNGVSYGEMIACDDNSCEKEWVRRLLSSPSLCLC
jgi:inhibitor of growth protein 3